MRFQKSFTRVVAAAGTTTLGTDTVPTGRPLASLDYYLSGQLKNIDGFPVQRVCCAYHGPTNAKALSAQLWLWDELTQNWYKSGQAVTMQPEAIAWFDQPSLQRLGAGAENASQNPGSLDICLIVSAAGSDPDGTYSFALGLDVSNNGASELPITATIDKTGLATSANQTTIDGHITTMSGKLPASVGAKAGAASLSVVPATDSTSQGASNATLPTWCTWIGASDGTKLQGLLIGQQLKASSLSVCMSSDSALLTANSPSATLVFPPQVTVGGAGGTTATQFGAQATLSYVLIQALSTNTVSVWIGGSDVTTSKGVELTPGASLPFEVQNLNQLWHISSTTGQKVNVKVV
jgi:hypothetical protein